MDPTVVPRTEEDLRVLRRKGSVKQLVTLFSAYSANSPTSPPQYRRPAANHRERTKSTESPQNQQQNQTPNQPTSGTTPISSRSSSVSSDTQSNQPNDQHPSEQIENNGDINVIKKDLFKEDIIMEETDTKANSPSTQHSNEPESTSTEGGVDSAVKSDNQLNTTTEEAKESVAVSNDDDDHHNNESSATNAVVSELTKALQEVEVTPSGVEIDISIQVETNDENRTIHMTVRPEQTIRDVISRYLRMFDSEHAAETDRYIIEKHGLLLHPDSSIGQFNLNSSDILKLKPQPAFPPTSENGINIENGSIPGLEISRSSPGEIVTTRRSTRASDVLPSLSKMLSVDTSSNGGSLSSSPSAPSSLANSREVSSPTTPPASKEKNFAELFDKMDRKSSTSSPKSRKNPKDLIKKKRSSSGFSASAVDPKNQIPGPLLINDALLEGFVHRRNKHRRWKKRWLVLDSQNIYCFKSPTDIGPPTKISLFCVSVKIPPSSKKTFEIVAADGTHEFEAESEKELLQWTALLEDVSHNLVHKSIGSGEDKSRKIHNAKDSLTSSSANLPNEESSGAKKELMQIMGQPENSICADCDSKNPEWASLNLGVFICISCSGAHRSLGTHISKIRSCEWDEWEQDQVTFMRKMGNKRANEIWEGVKPSNFSKPTHKDTLEVISEYVRAKYVRKEFYSATAADQIAATLEQNNNNNNATTVIYLKWEDGESVFANVPVSLNHTLLKLRGKIEEDRLVDSKQPYQFLVGAEPTSLRQEATKSIADVLTIDNPPTLILRKSTLYAGNTN